LVNKHMSRSEWMSALSGGLRKWSTNVSQTMVRGVNVELMAMKHPIAILSGATPGPFYHSHPHVTEEFDHVDFTMQGQVRENLSTIRKIAEAVTDYANDGMLPFTLSGQSAVAKDKSFKGIESPQILQWVSGSPESTTHPSGDCNFHSRLATVESVTTDHCSKLGMGMWEDMGSFESGGNVSDRRFMLETFAMFGIENAKHAPDQPPSTIRLDMKDTFDPKYFMPYVPGYVVSGGDLALFSVTAASLSNGPVPDSGEEQVEAVIKNMVTTLAGLGATFDDVVLLWDRVTDLDRDEHAVLMTRSKLGFDRPLAESCLEIAKSDTNGNTADGTPLYIEYIVVAQVPSQFQKNGYWLSPTATF